MDKNKFLENLEQIGLNEKEAKVYLSCLSLGQETVFKIAKDCGLKRPTVYFVLEKLKADGLVSFKQTKKAGYYSALNPHRLEIKLAQRQEKFSAIVPELEALYREQPDKPAVRVLEGKEAVELVYREIIEWVKTGAECLCYGSIGHLYQDADYKKLLDEYLREMKNKKRQAREVLPTSDAGHKDYAEQVRQGNNPNHQIRVLPAYVKFFDNDNIIYGNKLAIFSIKKGVFVTLIESENLVASYRNIFELMWRNSKLAK